MSFFRPCIDLHQGKVKQIVGGSLDDAGAGVIENYVSEDSPADFARRFRGDQMTGGHVIQLGPGNELAAREALAAWPGGLQVGGGITPENAQSWLEAGASHVIVTSWLFENGEVFSPQRLEELSRMIGRERLVVDLSCRRHGDGWVVATNRWQTLTQLELTHDALDQIAPYCGEFLIHAADVEGLCRGIDRELVAMLGSWRGCPVTYAGGATGMDDLRQVEALSGGTVDVTIGSALDLFGGSGVRYRELVEWNHQRRNPSA